ncbi:MAG: pyruvate kinase [Patescibacteria group bacterium]|nr:pyruvate kinase [Patescibacteria group bacterium]
MSIDSSKFKKTKIIATIGPASEEKLEQLLAAGVNGVRLNFSHGSHAWHKEIIAKARKAAKKLDRSVAIIQDLQGPKIRLGSLPQGGVELKAGKKIELCYHKDCKADHLPIQFDFSSIVKKGDRLFLRDGTIKAKILSTTTGKVVVEIQNSGKVLSNHGINLPDTVFDSKSIMTPKDMKDLEFTYINDVDYVALSFVQTASDIVHLKELLQKHKSPAKVIAKIETQVATHNLEEIIAVSDAVMIARGDLAIETSNEDVPMIARGDLAIETSNEDVPLIGRKIIMLARQYKKPVIMATQMLESMISSPQPSRAEVNDIASAVSLSVSCVMLSGETAMGQYPVQTVELMKRVILKSEQYFLENRLEIDFVPDKRAKTAVLPVEFSEDIGPTRSFVTNARKIFGHSFSTGKIASDEAQISVSLAAITLAQQVGAKIILAETLTGSTALSIASLRPPMPIIIASPSQRVCNQMSIVWGGKSYLVSKKQHISSGIIKKLKVKKSLLDGDWVVQAFGRNHSVGGGTDTVRLIEVK